MSVLIPLLVLFSEFGACKLTYDIRTLGYETSRLEYVLDYENQCNFVDSSKC